VVAHQAGEAVVGLKVEVDRPGEVGLYFLEEVQLGL
jgi:hypothetical protein